MVEVIESTGNSNFRAAAVKTYEPTHENNLGPVVQSSVNLTSSLRGQLVKCFTTM